MGSTHLLQRVDRCFYHVVWVRRAFRLRQYVAYTGTFEHSTHSTTCNYTCTRSSRLQQDKATAEFTFHFVGHSMLHKRDLKQVFLGIFSAFSNGVSYLIGFAKTITDHSVAVAHHYDGREAKPTTTLYNLGYTVDSDYALFQIGLVYFSWSYVRYHVCLRI